MAIRRIVHKGIEKELLKHSKPRYTLADWPKPFVNESGELDVTFVLGDSTDPRALDTAHISDAVGAMYILTYLSSKCKKFNIPQDPREIAVLDAAHWSPEQLLGRHNLISIGSTMVNTISKKILEETPIKFVIDKGAKKVSYVEIKGERISGTHKAVIFMGVNPFDSRGEKVALVIAGIGGIGTTTACFALVNQADEIRKAGCVISEELKDVLRITSARRQFGEFYDKAEILYRSGDKK